MPDLRLTVLLTTLGCAGVQAEPIEQTGQVALTSLSRSPRPDRLSLTGDAQTWHLHIALVHGIGTGEVAPVTEQGGAWPETVALHFEDFRGMEGLSAETRAADGTTAPIAVGGYDHARWRDAPLDYRIDTRALGPETAALTISWVDFYR